MNYERYEAVSASIDKLEFTFISEGVKGRIEKVVQFSPTHSPVVYNLGFGNLLPGGELDDLVANDNGDRNKILATVAATVKEFTKKYPEKYVFFRGSTPARTRLYRMALAVNLEELNNDFEILGLHENEHDVESFSRQSTYVGFFVKRKNA